jgi:hypothetical protein
LSEYLIARSSCGCIEAAYTDMHDADTDAAIADWVRRDLTIEKVSEPPQLSLCPLHLAQQELQLIRTTSIKVIEVSDHVSWLAGFIKGREPHCDTFWRSDFPDGISQPVESLPFNPSALEDDAPVWDETIDVINHALNEGFCAVRLVTVNADIDESERE